MNKQGIISLGEAIVDFVATGLTNTNYQRFLGGATVNVAVAVKRQEIPSVYFCKLGEDELSQFVTEELRRENVDISYSTFSKTKKMCSVYIHENEQGDRYFHSYVNETPDDWLTAEELNKQPFIQSKIFYFGSGTLFHPVARKTTDQALAFAREMNMQVAFDTNIRLKRWESEDQCRKTILSYMKRTDIVKMAEDELLFLTRSDTLEQGLESISTMNIPFVFITKGKEGAVALHEKMVVSVPALDVKVVDTTGAGDAFLAALLVEFHSHGLPKSRDQLERYTQIANEAAALSTAKLGSL